MAKIAVFFFAIFAISPFIIFSLNSMAKMVMIPCIYILHKALYDEQRCGPGVVLIISIVITRVKAFYAWPDLLYVHDVTRRVKP